MTLRKKEGLPDVKLGDKLQLKDNQTQAYMNYKIVDLEDQDEFIIVYLELEKRD